MGWDWQNLKNNGMEGGKKQKRKLKVDIKYKLQYTHQPTKQQMNANTTAIQYMGMIMRQQTMNIDYVLSMVQIVNNSYLSAKDVISILEQIFKHEKSSRILLATQILEYLIKNGNRNFHQAANKESFQKSVLGLLKRQRGKMSLIKQLRSNSENWSRIQSRILYLIQLWYDAFILQESKYPYIINNYKILRKQNVIFPPRNVNQRSLLAVQTESPIFDNIQSIAQIDKQKFKKRLKAMGLQNLSQKFDNKIQLQKKRYSEQRPSKQSQKQRSKQINIDQISQKIAIIQSQDYEPDDILKVIQDVKFAIEFGKVKPNQQKYWKDVKQAAEQLIQDWEQKNAKVIQNSQQKYLQAKMSGLGGSTNHDESPTSKSQKNINEGKSNEKKQVWDLLGDDPAEKQEQKPNNNNKNDFDDWGQFDNGVQQQQPQTKKEPQQLNLLDL